MAMILSISGWSQETVTIGTGTTTQNYVPSNTNWNYAVSQAMYLATDIEASGSITSIAWMGNTNYTRSFKIYLGTTSQESLTSALPDGDMTLVFDGTVTFTSGQWTTVELDDPFVYDGTENLVIGVFDVSGVYPGSTSWTSTSQSGRCVYEYNDDNAYTSFASATSTGTSYPNIQLTITPAGEDFCYAPATITVGNVETNTATVSWTMNENNPDASINLQYALAFADWDDEEAEITTVEGLTGTEYEITDLTGNTTYKVRIQSDCGSSLSSWKNASFTTSCDLITDFPWEEGFENTWTVTSILGGVAPNCWAVYNGGAVNTSTYNPDWMWGYSTTSHSGSGAAACYTDYNESPENHNDWLVSPLLPLDDNKLLTFWAQRASSTTSEPDEISIWISDEDIELTAPESSSDPLPGFTQIYQTDIPQGEWQLYEVPLTEYSGNRYIAFVRRNTPTDGWYLRLDDVKVDEMPACLHPTDVELSEITGHTVTIAWEGDADVISYKEEDAEEWIDVPVSESPYLLEGLTGATDYILKVGLTCPDGNVAYATENTFTTDVTCPAPVITIDDLTSESISISWTGTADQYTLNYKLQGSTDYINEEPIEVTENTYTIEDLETSTAYTIELQANCGEEDGESEVATLSFSTIMESVDLPYSTDFSGDEETGDRAWLFTNGTYSNYWAFGSLGTNEDEETVYGMFVTTDGTTPGYNNGSTSTVTTEKAFNVGPEGQIHIEFDVQVGGEGTYTPYDYLKVFLAPATWSEALSSYSYSNSTYAMDFSDYLSQTGISSYPYKLSLTQGNTIHISQDMTNPNPNGAVKLVFLWRNDGTSGTQPAANISNVEVSMVACSAPASINVSEVTDNSATVTLPEGFTYVVEYKESSNTDEDAWTPVTANENVAQITGLEAGTYYTVRAAVQCEENISDYLSTEFFTNCLPTVTFPYNESFEQATTEDWGCWTNTGFTVYNYSAQDGDQCAYMSANYGTVNASLVSPVFDFTVDGMDNPTLIFYYRTSTYYTNYSLAVSYRTDDESEWTEINTYSNEAIADWTRVELSLPEPSETYQIQFGATNTYYATLYLDNISVLNVSCPTPTDATIETTETTATLTMPEGHDYVVEYRLASNPEGEWSDENVSVTDNVATISELASGEAYDVRIATQCLGDDISEYIYRSFFTNCVTVTDFPYYESFENGTEINPFACWTVENASTSNEYVWTINSYNAQDGDYMAYMPWNPGSSSRLISPVFDLSSLSSPYLSFFYITGAYEDYYSGDIAVSTLAVYYKTEETTEWTQLGTTYDTELEDWTYASIALPEGTTQVMFLGEGNDGNGVYLDNISIMSIACDAPTNPTLSDITGHTVTVAWEGDADVLQYKLATAEEWETETVSENPFTLTGLAPESNYVVKVGATCDNGEISYAPNLQFTTDISCPAPVITLTDVTTSTATVTWTGEADSYTVSLKNAATNEFVEGAEEITVSENEYTFEDLTSTTTYTVSVKADCGEEDGESEVATLSFSTTMESVDLPYSTDFSGDEETGDRGWLFTNGTYSNYWAFGSLGTNAGGETVYGMFVTTDGTTPGYNNGSASTVITEKTFNVGPEGQIHVEFDANVGGEGTGSYSVYDYLKVFLAPATWSDALTSYTAGNYNDYAMNFADYLSQTGSSYFPYKLNLTQGNTIHISQDITNPDPNGVVKLVFLWRNDNSSGTQPAANISNVSVSMVSCSAPAFVTVSNVAARTATVTLPEEGNFVVEYKTAADEDWTEATVVDNVATLTGLTPETSYSVRAASLCGEDQLSSYVTASFTTTVACPAPVVTVSATTANSAIISYTGDAESYELKYKAAADEDWTTETITENPYTIENLSPSTSYTLELRANCGEEDGMSSAGTASFTTACVAVTDFPYEEGFEAGLGCWTSEIVVGTSDWATRTSYNGTTVYQGSQFVAIPNGRNRIARLVSPIFNLSSAESPVLTFAHIQKEWSGDQDTLGLYYRTSAEEDWTYITSWNQNISEWTVETINLPEPSATYQIAFLGYGDWGYGAGVDAINITTGTTPQPVQPTVATNAATEVSQTSAVLNGAITDEGNQTITARGFEWKLATATDYTTVSATGTTMTATLTGLTANTTYTYKAFATTALGTVYGSELTFTTLEQGEEPCTPVSMTITETVCYGETYTFNGQTYNATGTYTTTVAGQGTDCDTNYTINLTVLPQNTASETVTVCAGATATFNGQTLTEGTNTITVAGQGTDCDTLYTVTLVVLQPTSSTVEATICAGETYEFNGNTYNSTGNYTATLVNAAGCDSTVTLNLTVRPANAPIEETVTLNNNELPYTWRGEQYTEFGTYTVAGEDENGCPQEYVLTLVHNSGIAEVENEYSIALYPNPTSENATLSVKGLNEEATVIVTDQAGRVISTSTLALGQETMEVETSKLASGVYYIRIQTANSVRTEKLIRK